MTEEPISQQDSAQWEGDAFERKKYADFLTKLLCSKSDPYVLNINAEWGTGKTFFLEKWQKDLQANYPTIYFNAWKKDFIEDPFLAFMSEIQNRLAELAPKANKRASKIFTTKLQHLITKGAPIAIKGYLKNKIGQEETDDLFTLAKDTEDTMADIAEKFTEIVLNPVKEEEESFGKFKKSLKEILVYIEENTKYNLPLFIFVDELDRCRPIFAIKTLERIKHLFDIPQIKFVVATDTKQLSFAVKAIYGEGFDGRAYLKRFFSQEFNLPDPHSMNFATTLFLSFSCQAKIVQYNISGVLKKGQRNHQKGASWLMSGPIDTPNRELSILFALYASWLRLDLRTQQQCYERWCAIAATAHEYEVLHPAYIFFLIMLKAKDEEAYYKFMPAFIPDDVLTMLSNQYPQDEYQLVFTNTFTSFSDKDKEVTSARQLIIKYHDLLKQDRDKLLPVSPQFENTAWENITKSIYENYDQIHRYKERIDLVGFLS